MLRNWQKKGLSHVDWAMSLSIFIIFILWFFLVIRPVVEPAEDLSTLFDVVQDGLDADLYVDFDMLPVFITQDVSNTYEPIFFDFGQNWSVESMYLTGAYLVPFNGKLFFLGDTSAEDEFDIYHADDASFSQSSGTNIVSNPDYVQTGTFRVDFDDSLMTRMMSGSDYKLTDFKVYVDEHLFQASGSAYESYNSTPIFAYYGVEDQVNHSTYVFAENTRVYSLIDPLHRPRNIMITATVDAYLSYYIKPSSFGEPDYSFETCTEVSSDFVDLYGGGEGMLFVFSSEADFEICPVNDTLEISATFDVPADEEGYYHIFLHSGDYSSVLNYPVAPVMGIVQTTEGVSHVALINLNQTDYADKKNDWNYPQERDFRIAFDSSLISIDKGEVPSDMDNVFVRKVNTYIFDSDMNKEKGEFRISVW